MKRWPEVELGSRCEVFSGYPFKSAQFTEDPDDVALVKGENVGQGEILWEISKRWPRGDAEDLCRYWLEPDDVVLAMDRPWVPAGLKFARIRASDPEALLVQRVARLRAFDGLDQNFLYCVIASPEFVAYIKNIGRGVGVPHISGKQIGEYLLRLPPPQAQRSIADILSAYDDLIENNRRRMVLLEEAARQLYREWFVRLRFPGHEHTRITKGLPEGWERRRIGDVADCVGGGTPSTSVSIYWEDGKVTWVTPTDVTRNRHFVLLDSEKKITGAGLQNDSAKLVPPHAVLMTSRASVGFCAVAGKEVCTNQGFISIVANDATLAAYFLFHLSQRVEEIRAMGSGSTYPEVSRGKFRELEVLLPKHSLVTAFCEYVNELLKQIRVLKQQNEKLRAARDLLLPRLMSGEIAV